MYRRFITRGLLESLKDTPVVLVSGARQTGKTTLVQDVARSAHPARYISLDDAGYLSAASSDPAGFLAGIDGPVVIDEIQHVPALFPVIKACVDSDRRPGRFFLAGSANALLVPKLSESLAGRMDILTLWPLAQAEIAGIDAVFVDTLFAGKLRSEPYLGLSRTDLINRIIAGGYPEPLSRPSQSRRRAWFTSYITAILQRDVRDLSNIEGLTEMPRLLELLATRMASLLNVADISRSAGMPYTTLQRYMTLLQATFLIQHLPAWSSNLGIRLTRSPKVIINDTGLAASLIGLNVDRLQGESVLFGHILENFVAMEVIKCIGVSAIQPKPFHYRTTAGIEVDLVLEAPDGRLVAVEVKASATVTANDFRGVRSFAEVTGDRFARGIVFYTGQQVIPFGERLYAIPVQALWSPA